MVDAMHRVNKRHFWPRTVLTPMPHIGDDVPTARRAHYHTEQVLKILAALNGAEPKDWTTIITAPATMTEEEREVHKTTVLVAMLQDHILRDACPAEVIYEAESWMLDHSMRCWLARPE